MTPRGSDARRPNAASGTAYGVDGCSAGWFYFALARSGAPDWGIASTIKELVSSADDSDRIFVDIPIGLPDGREGRGCDTEARGRLRAPRASSVFPVPVRAALFAATYEEASRVNREASEKGLTRQTFAVLRKIREVDRLLRRSEKARRIVREIHPEICFWALAGGSPMGHSKKKGAGFDKRLALLKGFHPSVLGERVGTLDGKAGREAARWGCRSAAERTHRGASPLSVSGRDVPRCALGQEGRERERARGLRGGSGRSPPAPGHHARP